MKLPTSGSRVALAALWSFAFVLWSNALLAEQSASSPIPSNDEIRQILADRVGDPHRGIAIVVGVIDANGRRVVTFGTVAKDDSRPLDGNTVFEIGSVTKVFTSLVLMDMVQKGEVAVTDPVGKFLPSTVKVPERNGKQVTLQDLATQSSGLPRMPSNFSPKDRNNPYADYTAERLYAFLSGYELPRDIGSKFEYSNLGVGLLGHALSLRDGRSFEAMVQARVLEPLGMKSTGITLTPEMKARLAPGHGSTGEPTANWDLGVLAGAGGLRSSANDMLKFLAANLGYEKTSLAAAMAAQLGIRRPAGGTNTEIAYNWFVQTKDGRSIVWHNGGTGGYRTYVGFDPQARTGVVVLTNLSSPAGGDDLGRHLLDSTYALGRARAPKEHVAIAVDPKTLEKYVGTYQLRPQMLMTISREGDQLYGQLTGQEKYPIFPEGEGEFFLKVVDAQLTFEADADGKVPAVTLHQNGRDQRAARVNAHDVPVVQSNLENRLAEHTPAPGAEKALRRNIEELRAGQPNYDLLVGGLVDATRRQLPHLQQTLKDLGAIETITFDKTDRRGVDVFKVKFEHGSTEWRIVMQTDEKVSGLGMRRL